MPTKTAEEHLNNSRLGAYSESLVKTFLLEYCDFAYDTQSKHPADLIVELSQARYSVQVKARNVTTKGKYVFASENGRKLSDTYKRYNVDILAMVFMPEKRIMFKPASDSQNYYTFGSDILTPTLEIDSFQETFKNTKVRTITNAETLRTVSKGIGKSPTLPIPW